MDFARRSQRSPMKVASGTLTLLSALAHVEKNEVRRAYTRGEYWEERVRLAEWWASFLDEAKHQ